MRTVYVTTEDQPDQPSTRLTFTVDLDYEGRVVSCEAIDAKGQVWGIRATA